MNTVCKSLSMLALVAFSAAPVVAQDKMDMSKMTCGELMKMDKDGMMMAAENADMMMKSDGMSDADKMAMKEKMDKMSDTEKTDHMKMTEENMMKMEAACKGNDSMMVMDAMKG